MRDLPHELVAAFRATLTETREAALLLHVIDASDPHHEDRCRQVETVIEQIGAADRPCIRVYNKVDRLPPEERVLMGGSADSKLLVSAATGTGLEALRTAIRRATVGHTVCGSLRLDSSQSRARARLFSWRAVRAERVDVQGGWTLDVELSVSRWQELRDSEGLSADSLLPQGASAGTGQPGR